MKQIKIYIASSWKNQHAVEMLTENLEVCGHEVISFVRESALKEDRNEWAFRNLDEWINSYAGEEKFKYDLNGATKSDLVIYIGPSGCDAWAEVGAAWASNVPIFGLLSKGEQSGLMRRMISHWFNNYIELLKAINLFDDKENL